MSNVIQSVHQPRSDDNFRDVRRAALMNLPLTPSTLPLILARARDVDPAIRKLVYTSVLASRLPHPRLLSAEQREKSVRDGLNDREKSVQEAAGGMLRAWLDACKGDTRQLWNSGRSIAVEDRDATLSAMVQFLNLFDLTRSGRQVSHDALLYLFTTIPKLSDILSFDGV